MSKKHGRDNDLSDEGAPPENLPRASNATSVRDRAGLLLHNAQVFPTELPVYGGHEFAKICGNGRASTTVPITQFLQQHNQNTMDPLQALKRVASNDTAVYVNFKKDSQGCVQARHMAVKRNTGATYTMFLAHQGARAAIDNIPTTTTEFPLTDAQRVIIAFLVFGPGLVGDVTQYCVIDADITMFEKCSGRVSDKPERQMTYAQQQPISWSGTQVMNGPTGTGKTLMSLMVGVMKLGTTSTFRHIEQNFKDDRAAQLMASAGNGWSFVSENPTRRPQLCRAMVVLMEPKAGSQLIHFQDTLANILPKALEKLPATLKIEIWTLKPNNTLASQKLTACVASTSQLSVVRLTNKLTMEDLFNAAPAGGDTMVVMVFPSEGEHMKFLRRGKNNTEVQNRHFTIPLCVLDEGLCNVNPLVAQTGPVFLSTLILQATPVELAKRQAPKSSILFDLFDKNMPTLFSERNRNRTPCQYLGPASLHKIFESMCRLNLLQVLPPQALLHLLADMSQSMPNEIRIFQVPTRRTAMVVAKQGSDAFSTTSLQNFLNQMVKSQFRGMSPVLQTTIDTVSATNQGLASATVVTALNTLLQTLAGIIVPAYMAKEKSDTIATIKRTLAALNQPQDCPICICTIPVAGKVIVPCCANIVCTACLRTLFDRNPQAPTVPCVHCRRPLTTSIVMPTATPQAAPPPLPMPTAETQLAVHLNANPKLIDETMKAIFSCLKAIHRANRVLLFCATNRYGQYVKTVIGRVNTAYGATVCKYPRTSNERKTIISREYLNTKAYPAPIVLMLENSNRGADFAGLNLWETQAIVILNEPCDLPQIVGRGARSQSAIAGQHLPVWVIDGTNSTRRPF